MATGLGHRWLPRSIRTLAVFADNPARGKAGISAGAEIGYISRAAQEGQPNNMERGDEMRECATSHIGTALAVVAAIAAAGCAETVNSEFSLWGEVRGLEGDGIVLSLNDGSQSVAVDENGAFQFDDRLMSGSGFTVRVSEQPGEAGLHCRVARGQGVVLDADVDDILVRCSGRAPRAISQDHAVTLRWEHSGPVDVMYSTDPYCDWTNYSLCDESGMVAGADTSELTLTVDSDGLVVNQTYFFVLEHGGRRSGMVAAQPYQMTLDDNVETMIEQEGVVFAGGRFTGIRPETGGWVAFDGDDGELVDAAPMVQGSVATAAPDGEGGWYLGGNFSVVGGQDRQKLAHVDAAGVPSDWNPGSTVDGRITSLVLKDGRVFVGGNFDTAEGTAQSNLVALDARTGTRLNWNADTNNTVYSLVAHEGVIYLGGGFTEAGGDRRDGLAAFDAVSGELTNWNPGIGENVGTDAYEDYVETLLVHDDTLYVGGDFTRAGGVARRHLAALDLDSGDARGWSVNMPGPVYSLAADDGVVFVGGRFNYTGTEGRSDLMAFDADTGQAVDGVPHVDGTVYSIAVDSGRIYTSGRILTADGQFRPGFAAFDRQDGAVLDWQPGTSGVPMLVAVDNNTVFTGGGFRQAGGVNRGRIAAYDAASGEVLDWAPHVDDRVNSIAIYNDRLYAGGRFSTANGEDRDLIAAFELEDASVTDWRANFTQDYWYSGHINVLRVLDGMVYAGGDFVTADGDGRNGLAAFDAESAALLAWDPGATNNARSLFLGDDAIYAGGTIFLNSNRQLFAFDRTGGAQLDIVPTVRYETVTTFESRNDVIYAGGYFHAIDGVNQPWLAAFSADTGELTAWRPSINGSVNSLLMLDDVLYVGGHFSEAEGEARSGLAAFDTVSGDLQGWNPDNSSFVRALTGANGLIHIGSARPFGQTPRQPLIMAVDAETGARVW